MLTVFTLVQLEAQVELTFLELHAVFSDCSRISGALW